MSSPIDTNQPDHIVDTHEMVTDTNQVSEVLQGDCLELMKDIPDGSVDMILADLPYGTTACKWDTIIPFEPLWEQYKRIIKPNGAIVLTAQEPFATHLRMSSFDMYRYDWYWKKSKPGAYQHAKNKPMTAIENVCVFSPSKIGHRSLMGGKRMEYNPQGVKESGVKVVNRNYNSSKTRGERPNQLGRKYMSYTGFPSDLLEFGSVVGNAAQHPTQKPVALFEYLIKTYTNEGDLVLDNVAGSGTTGVACQNTNRNFILMEQEPEYVEIIKKRLELNKKQLEAEL